MSKENQKSMSCRKVVMRHLPMIVSDGMVNGRKEIRRSRIKSGMTPNLMGFTLIELLVVVLIIGILAAVALPQYQKAVEKAKLINLLTLMRSVSDAQETYYLANGEYATDMDALSIDLPLGTNVSDTIYLIPKDKQTIMLSGVGSGVLYGSNHRFQIDWKLLQGGWMGKTPGIYCLAKTTDNLGTQICASLSKGTRTTDGCGSINREFTPSSCYVYPISF